MLVLFYIICSRTGITSPCSNSMPNYWKKCLLMFLFEQTEHFWINLMTTTWSRQRPKERCCICRACLACGIDAVSLVPSLCELFWCQLLFSQRYVSTLVHMWQVRVSEISFSKKSLSKLKYLNEMSAMKNAEGSKHIY